jgi:hypothetical protein|tara:strand:- start:11843 stop:12541 length:699 start_codon:yes stop_codon:yes gene_type:complete
MVEVLGANINVPTFFGTGDTLVFTVFLVILSLIMVGGGVFWMYWNWKVYNRKIVVFENISGQGFQRTLIDRARLVKVGEGGEEILYLRKKKTYRTAYGKKMGKNEYWFAVGQDGYWYNCVLGDLDAKMGMLDIEPIDRDMRYMHVAIRKNIETRYRKKTAEKVVAIAIGGLILMSLILMIGGWYMFDKMAETANVINKGVELSQTTMETQREIVSSLDNVVSRSSGISDANG